MSLIRTHFSPPEDPVRRPRQPFRVEAFPIDSSINNCARPSCSRATLLPLPHHATYDFPAASRPSLPRRFPARGRPKVSAKSIQFKGDPEYSDQELLAAAGLKKGAVLTSAEMNDHSKQLMEHGVFDTLTFKFDGQDLVYSLVPSAHHVPHPPGKPAPRAR